MSLVVGVSQLILTTWSLVDQYTQRSNNGKWFLCFFHAPLWLQLTIFFPLILCSMCVCVHYTLHFSLFDQTVLCNKKNEGKILLFTFPSIRVIRFFTLQKLNPVVPNYISKESEWVRGRNEQKWTNITFLSLSLSLSPCYDENVSRMRTDTHKIHSSRSQSVTQEERTKWNLNWAIFNKRRSIVS